MADVTTAQIAPIPNRRLVDEFLAGRGKISRWFPSFPSSRHCARMDAAAEQSRYDRMLGLVTFDVGPS